MKFQLASYGARRTGVPPLSPETKQLVRNWLRNWKVRSLGSAPPRVDNKTVQLDSNNQIQVIGLATGVSPNALSFGSGATAANSSNYVGSNGNTILNTPTGTSNRLLVNGTFGFGFSAGSIDHFAGIATAGLGAAAVYASGAQTLYTNSAPTTLSYTPPATAGVYAVLASLDILTGGTQTFQIKITYHDPGGNSRTDIPVFTQQNSTTLLAGSPGANATGRFSFLWVFAIDNSATAITVADNAGTYTAGTYYWNPQLLQFA